MKSWTPERQKEFRRELYWELEKNLKMAQKTHISLTFEDILEQMKKHKGMEDETFKELWKSGLTYTEKGNFEKRISFLKDYQIQRQKNQQGHFWLSDLTSDLEISSTTLSSPSLDFFAGPGPYISTENNFSMENSLNTPNGSLLFLYQQLNETCKDELHKLWKK
ncbi:hypothetical protein IE077_002947, partial [Cardiosporidium cionae]